MELRELSVQDLRIKLRQNPDIMKLNNLSGTDVIRMNKDYLISVLSDNEDEHIEELKIEPATHKDNGNGSDNLADVIASAIQDKIKPSLDLEQINNLIDSRLKGIIAPNIISVKVQDTDDIKDMGIQHRDFERIFKLVSMRIDTFLVGPAGSGKTTLCENIAESLDLDFYFMPVGLQTTKSDLIGYFDATGQYVKSHLREAYENGGVFLLDEIDAGNPNVLTVINAMLSNGVGSFPDAMIKRHADFIFIAAGNTYGKGSDRVYVGRNQIDGATLDRFAVIDFDYDENLETAIAGNEEWTRKVQAIRKTVYDMKEKIIVSPRASIQGSKALANGFDINQVEDMFIFRGINPEIKSRILVNLS